ncbi:hypothetical protein [Bacillus sp. JCM 19034]|uniref:hypothetical protein n=1 Tax=Bacillus sp. JCM 19034 TaxID=1481928 RepID=UPI000783D5A2|nr:hypothetical protein [Bacillus sp. JCM 19034]
MSKRQKCLAAVSIFLVLFSGGWYAHEYNERQIHLKGLDNYQIQQLDDGVDRMGPFKPREYIRIGPRERR